MSRATWTDERLDDFACNVDRRFDDVDRDLRDLRSEMNEGFAKVDGKFDRIESKFDRIESKFDRIDGRIDALHRGVLQVGSGMIATLVIGFVGIVVTQS